MTEDSVDFSAREPDAMWLTVRGRKDLARRERESDRRGGKGRDESGSTEERG